MFEVDRDMVLDAALSDGVEKEGAFREVKFDYLEVCSWVWRICEVDVDGVWHLLECHLSFVHAIEKMCVGGERGRKDMSE